MAILLLLLLFFAGPPLLGGWLLTRYVKLGRGLVLPGGARPRHLVALASLAALITLLGYIWVLVLSEPIPGAHAASRSAWPWAHEHPLLVVLLASLLATLLLLRQPGLGRAGLLFGAGALFASGCVGLWGAVNEQQAARQAASAYDARAWQPAANQRRDTCAPAGRGVLFPGSDFGPPPRRLVRPPAYRVPGEAFVGAEYLVEADGRVTLPHGLDNQGPGYGKEAVRVVQALPEPVFSPNFDREGKPRQWSVR